MVNLMPYREQADDGRTWDQVRFDIFPPTAAFMAVALDLSTDQPR